MPKGLVRAIPLKNFLVTAISTTANGTAFDLGQVSSSQSLYGALHLMTAASTARALSMTIQSATSSGFTTPTTRITFTLSSARGSTWALPVSGLSTDPKFWRAAWTLSTAISTEGAPTGLVWMGIENTAVNV